MIDPGILDGWPPIPAIAGDALYYLRARPQRWYPTASSRSSRGQFVVRRLTLR